MADDLSKIAAAIFGKSRNQIKQNLKELKSQGIIKDFTLKGATIQDENGNVIKRMIESEVVRNNDEKVFGVNG